MALIVFRRWRHLLIYLVTSQVVQLAHARLYDMAEQPRPFGVPLRGSWAAGRCHPFTCCRSRRYAVIALYTMVPAGRPRNRLKWAVAGGVLLIALARLHLGVDSPSGILIGVLVGVGFAVTAFRFFAPSELFPVTRHGRTAHLDVGGPR